ncbi:MAG TPA: branched-chain amino acid ABC transporter substrate-binding protein [Acidimicrobiales bacterium]|jgi:branched-chain amino acid transport system substrate-binding protein|nr:branched-chain amino acid ABC transporter substrate-binding protein [Acidimicrobiales bacterium]
MLVGSLALIAAACGKSTSTTNTTGAGGCPSGLTIGFFGALTGNNSPQLGINEANGTQLAISQFNTAHPNCHITYKAFDSQGDPAQAPQLAQNAVGDAKVVAIVGPAFSGESKVADPIFDAGGIPIITASATNPALASNGWTIFHRAVANDDAQAPAIARFVTSKLNAKKVAVVDDASAYGKGLADIVRTQLMTASVSVTSPGSIDKSHNYPSTVNAIKAAGVDAVVYGGYYQEAGPLALQLKTAGVTAAFISGDGSLDKGFVDGATVSGAEGAYLTAPAAYALTAPEDQAFVSAYTAKFSTPPALYSGEAYDATNHFLAAILAGKYTRAAINTYVSTTSYKGLLKTYSYATNGELNGTPVILVHKVVNGMIRLVGPA